MKKSMLIVAGMFTLAVSTALGFSGNASAASCTSGLYRKGSSGTCVKYIQQMLNGATANGQSSCLLSGTWSNGVIARDATNVISADGAFGSITDARTRAFQKSHCLTADGIVGSKTWASLCDEGVEAGYKLSGPGWYDPNSSNDRLQLTAYKASVYAGCQSPVSWPFLMNY